MRKRFKQSYRTVVTLVVTTIESQAEPCSDASMLHRYTHDSSGASAVATLSVVALARLLTAVVYLPVRPR